MIPIPLPFSGYANFAHGEFATVRNQIYYVTILKRNYVGAIHELQFADNPLTIATIGAGDTESPIKPQELTLRLNVTSDPLFLLAVNSFEYQIKVTGGGMVWEGYIVADQWSEPFLPPPYTIEVRFVDGLSLLKNFMFADAGGYMVGRTTWLNTIAFILSKLGKGCFIRDDIDIIENRNTSNIAGFLADTMVDLQAFDGLTCYEALEKMLYPLFQIVYEQETYIIRRVIMTQNFWSLQYDYRGHFVDGITRGNIQNILCNDRSENVRYTWIGESQQLDYLPAKRKINVTHNYGRKESIIPRWSFRPDDFAPTGEPKGWTSANAAYRHIDGKDCLEFGFGLTGEIAVNITPDYIQDDEAFILDITQRHGEPLLASLSNHARRSENLIAVRQEPQRVITAGQVMWQMDIPEFLLPESSIIVFEGSREPLPSGFYEGVVYRMTNMVRFPGSPTLHFHLSESVAPIIPIPLPTTANGKQYNIVLNPNILPTLLTVGGRQLGQRGAFIAGMDTPMILEPFSANNRFSDVGFGCDPHTRWQAPNGQISLRINKPFYPWGWVTYLIDQVKLYFADTPEKNEYEILLSTNSTQDKDVTIYFGEIYRNAHIDFNSALKYYNALIYRDGSAHGTPAVSFRERSGDAFLVKNYLQMVNELFAYLYLNPRKRITGTLWCSEPITERILVEPTTQNLFTQAGWIWDVALHRWEVQLHEIGRTDAAAPRAFTNGFSNGFQ